MRRSAMNQPPTKLLEFIALRDSPRRPKGWSVHETRTQTLFGKECWVRMAHVQPIDFRRGKRDVL